MHQVSGKIGGDSGMKNIFKWAFIGLLVVPLPLHVLAESAGDYCARGRAYYDNHNWANAIAEYSKAIAIDPSGQCGGISAKGAAYYYRGVAYDHNGDYPQAITDLKKAVELNPDDEAAKTALKEASRLEILLPGICVFVNLAFLIAGWLLQKRFTPEYFHKRAKYIAFMRQLDEGLIDSLAARLQPAYKRFAVMLIYGSSLGLGLVIIFGVVMSYHPARTYYAFGLEICSIATMGSVLLAIIINMPSFYRLENNPRSALGLKDIKT